MSDENNAGETQPPLRRRFYLLALLIPAGIVVVGLILGFRLFGSPLPGAPTATATPKPTHVSSVLSTVAPEALATVANDPNASPTATTAAGATAVAATATAIGPNMTTIRVETPLPPTATGEPGRVPFLDPILGVAATGQQGDDIGRTSTEVNEPEPHLYFRRQACAAETVVRVVPPPELAPEDALADLYESDYVASDPDLAWELLAALEPLDVDGAPAARLRAQRTDPDDGAFLVQLTLVAGARAAALVESVLEADCADAQEVLADVTATADSVELFAPESICYVGQQPGTNPADFAVACDDADSDGPDKLAAEGYDDVVLGPVTWEEGAAFMRENDQAGW
jgi:hypothetical protein